MSYTTTMLNSETMDLEEVFPVTHETSSNTSTALPDSEIRRLLNAYNREKSILYIPILVYIAILMLSGLFGNILVIYIYARKFKKRASYHFIIFMAVVDLLACAIGMPTEIYDIMHTVTYNSESTCKILRYTESVTIQASALILVAVSIDRYNKICRPTRTLLYRNAKRACVCIGVYSLVTTTPTLVVYGLKSAKIANISSVVQDCSVADVQIIPGLIKVWFAYLAILFIASVVTITVLYTRVWIHIRRRHKAKKIQDARRKQASQDLTEISLHETSYVHAPAKSENDPEPDSFQKQEPHSDVVVINDENTNNTVSHLSPASYSRKSSSLAQSIVNIKVAGDQAEDEYKMTRSADERMKRTTKILFVVTVAFVVAFLPSLVAAIVNSRFSQSLSAPAVDVTMKLLSRLYFINNAINPVIYSLMNLTFRRETLISFRKFQEKIRCQTNDSPSPDVSCTMSN